MEIVDSLKSKRLKTVLIGNNQIKVHPAWVDDTNEGFLICYEIQLVFDDGTMYLAQPCEHSIDGRCPALCLRLNSIDSLTVENVFPVEGTPLLVTNVISSDNLGKDVVNQWVLNLENGMHLVIRHVYPPMSLGIRVAVSNA